MGKVMQIDENAPQAVKDALDRKEISVNQGYNITRELQDVPEAERDENARIAVELAKAGKELRKKNAEADRRGKIAGIFCKAVEKAILVEATEENVRYWVEGARMRPDEIALCLRNAREISETFAAVADLLVQMYPDAAAAEDGELENGEIPESETDPEDGEPMEDEGFPDSDDSPESNVASEDGDVPELEANPEDGEPEDGGADGDGGEDGV